MLKYVPGLRRTTEAAGEGNMKKLSNVIKS